MTQTYFAILTAVGEAKLANATALNVPLQITQMGVGDGGGAPTTPTRAQIALVGEKRRAAINRLSIDPDNANQIVVEQVIPENVGGWWIREIGLYDADSNLIAVANCPESYKPQLAEGSGRTQVIRMILVVSSTEAVSLKIDPSVVLATREYCDAQDAKRQPLDATLTALAALGFSADKMLYTTGDNEFALADLTLFARTLLDDKTALDARTTLGIPGAIQALEGAIGTADGTADAITATFTPAIATLTDGMRLYVRAAAANATTTPTFTPASGTIAAKTIVRGAGSSLVAGDIAGGGHWIELQYDSNLDKWVLQNPANSAGALLNIQVFTSTATYTPTPGTKSVEVEIQAPGGGSGGVASTAAGQAAMSAPGGAGAWARGRFTSGFSGVTVTVGAAGAQGAAGSNAGGTGGTTSFGALMSCPGGVGGAAGVVSSYFPNNTGITAQTAPPSGANIVGSVGAGGSQGMITGTGIANGLQATMSVMGYTYGRGAAGGYSPPSSAAIAGNQGGAGIVIVKEYA